MPDVSGHGPELSGCAPKARSMQSVGSVDLGRNGWLRAPAAAAYVGLSVSTMAKMRCRGDGAEWSVAGAKIIVYAVEDLDAWLNSKRRRPAKVPRQNAPSYTMPILAN